MSTALEKREQVLPEVKAKILKSINRGFVNSAEDIAELYEDEITEEQAVELLNDDEFYLAIANQTRAKMRMLYNTKGVKVLEDLLDSEESKDKIAAYDRLAKATGGIQEEKAGTNNFNFFNIEDLLEAKEKREKVVNPEFNRVKTNRSHSERSEDSNSKKSQDIPNETVNGNIFENEETDVQDLEYDLESYFEESEELEFND